MEIWAQHIAGRRRQSFLSQDREQRQRPSQKAGEAGTPRWGEGGPCLTCTTRVEPPPEAVAQPAPRKGDITWNALPDISGTPA